MRKNKSVIETKYGKTFFLKILDLFWTFFKIGIVCFGGGYTMIALIEKEIVEKKQWITSEDMLNIIAIAETTPGPIAINTSTYVGFRKGGVIGAIAATFGVVLPSFAIICAISFFIDAFSSNIYVAYALKGMRIGALVLILGAVIRLFKKTEKTIFGIIILLATFFITYFTSFGIIYTLLCCAAAGIIYCLIFRLIKYIKEVNL